MVFPSHIWERETPLSFYFLPENNIENHCDDADAESTPCVTLCSLEQLQVDRQSLWILLLVNRVAVEPYTIATNKDTEEDECLETDVVQISCCRCSIAHEYHYECHNDEGSTNTTENLCRFM